VGQGSLFLKRTCNNPSGCSWLQPLSRTANDSLETLSMREDAPSFRLCKLLMIDGGKGSSGMTLRLILVQVLSKPRNHCSTLLGRCLYAGSKRLPRIWTSALHPVPSNNPCVSTSTLLGLSLQTLKSMVLPFSLYKRKFAYSVVHQGGQLSWL